MHWRRKPRTGYDGWYFTGWRGGLGFVYLTGKQAKVYPVLFDDASTFEAFRITALDIPLTFLKDVVPVEP